MNMERRSYRKELLDEDNIPFNDILTLMQELNVINTYLGGHAITCKGVAYFLNKTMDEQQLVIAEIGCGGGDNLTTIHNFTAKAGRPAKLIGIDIKEECIQFARQNNRTPGVTWICSDYRTVQWPGGKPDIIFSSLFCHHFTDEQLAGQLKWLKENSRLGFFINDLHRHPAAYYSISIIAKMFSKSYLIKNDAPLSVMRSFKKKEWVELFSVADIQNYSIKWQWAFRYLICSSNEQ
jgi:2-polyprenyl-3-methyl-5-hydroxy-6-metoxy-1,4-benzoquinol methylase